MIDYKKRLTTFRQMNEIDIIDYSIESDRGRILSSAALRRLQKRTQVFALELNASIRSRLTHSIEVAQNARFIAKTILAKLKDEGLDKYGLEELENAFISTAEMTSLLHDIGNPPFGHFAEQTINKWMSKNALPIFEEFEALKDENKKLKEMLSFDLCNYDGNAQALRVIMKLQRMNLSYTQIISVLKYTRGAYEEKPKKDSNLSYVMKKPGFYYSEKDSILKIQEKLGIKAGHRFPITYIMEAADDISYLTADLEDSHEKGILSLKKIYRLITEECKKQEEEYLLKIVEEEYTKAQAGEKPYQFNMFFTIMRARLVGSLVRHVAEVYIQNHEKVFEGSFNSALLEYDEQSKYYKAIKVLQTISTKYIYQNKDVQTLELQSYKIINSLFDNYKPLLELKTEDFLALLEDKKIDCFISMRLIKRISSKQIVAYENDINALDKEDKEAFKILEWYHRVRLIIDYISGMTDDYALEEYKVLSALNK
ncbi:dGTPase [Halarcobacter bivalviorum]|uniref:DGTPase n=1 Tax=Halarcobacter bivalviorum TaxID=663364 RepID=A0AAX2ACG7_9BACT|nr:dGTPase [Halarcobacter bivalviorum]AXH12027.1 dGTP triphosphohydrolase [Halarcobacter bivalviorum]RXK11140.1 dGTPase [Halarcobacter bivalviorum]